MYQRLVKIATQSDGAMGIILSSCKTVDELLESHSPKTLCHATQSTLLDNQFPITL